MGWKEWPTWLKGGVIGLILSVLFLIGLIICASSSLGSGSYGCINFIFPLFFGAFMASILNIQNKFVGYFVIGFTNLIIYFLIGALIGWIVGKIKNRNKR
jgi:hypothetical protein